MNTIHRMAVVPLPLIQRLLKQNKLLAEADNPDKAMRLILQSGKIPSSSRAIIFQQHQQRKLDRKRRLRREDIPQSEPWAFTSPVLDDAVESLEVPTVPQSIIPSKRIKVEPPPNLLLDEDTFEKSTTVDNESPVIEDILSQIVDKVSQAEDAAPQYAWEPFVPDDSHPVVVSTNDKFNSLEDLVKAISDDISFTDNGNLFVKKENKVIQNTKIERIYNYLKDPRKAKKPKGLNAVISALKGKPEENAFLRNLPVKKQRGKGTPINPLISSLKWIPWPTKF